MAKKKKVVIDNSKEDLSVVVEENDIDNSKEDLIVCERCSELERLLHEAREELEEVNRDFVTTIRNKEEAIQTVKYTLARLKGISCR